MDENMVNFQLDLNEDIDHRAVANDCMKEESFSEIFCEYLVEYGEADYFEQASWRNKNLGAKVDAYHFDDDVETVTIVVTLWKELSDFQDGNLNVTNTEIDSMIKRAKKFFTLSLEGKLPGDRIDPGSPAFEVANSIRELRNSLTTARIVLITNGITKPKEGTVEEINGKAVQVSIWDAPRIISHIENKARKGITIDFNEYGGPINCVEQVSTSGKYTTYLGFVSGEILADLYSVHKTRLLEMNVRVFLQQRGGVNKGIRNTINNEPDMFCAYNNGITVYAENIDLEHVEGNMAKLSVVKDFQIVNGGQTTASLYHTRKKDRVDLNDISVQMKLMVIHDENKEDGMRLADTLVPKIGRFSNTQNKIQMSDLSANDPPHVELWHISQKSQAPDPTGGTKTSYWFYERSRGAWAETKNMQATTRAQRKAFDSKYPRSQRFDKGKFAYVWYSNLQKPHIVSLGSQKCFAQFHTNFLTEQVKEGQDWPQFFRKTVGLLMIWNDLYKEVRKRVRSQIYSSYATNITSYTMSLFSYITKQKIDLEKLWKTQIVAPEIKDFLYELSEIVHDHITDLPQGVDLVPEYCKREDCWNNLLKRSLPSAPSNLGKFIFKAQRSYSAGKSEDELNIEFCISKGADAWGSLAKFLKDRDFGQPKQRSQCGNMARILRSGRNPSPALSHPCKKIWESAVENYGWTE